MYLRPSSSSAQSSDLERKIADTRRRRPASYLQASLRDGAWIYGAGEYGRLIFGLMTARGFACRGFIDRRAGDRALDATLLAPVVAPSKLTPGDVRGQAMVVALHNFATDQTPIVEWARELGFGEVLIPAELPDILGADAQSYWLADREHIATNIDSVTQLIDMLDDPVSVATVESLAHFRASGNIVDHPPADVSDQYFPRDLNFAHGAMRLVDGGAYTGDIVEAAMRAGVTIDQWWAFEPDLLNFASLVGTAKTADIPSITLFPAGLGETQNIVSFSAVGAAGSHAAAEGHGTAQVVSFDDVLHGAAPTHVKLDVEGFEREALTGMWRTLAKARPRLAVSIYHKPEDLWELPFLARELLPDSTFHVRQHGFNGFDTVLYVMPRTS